MEKERDEEIEITDGMVDYVVGELLRFNRDGVETETETATRIIREVLGLRANRRP